MGVIFALFFWVGVSNGQPRPGTWNDFVGTNSNVASWDNGFLPELAQATLWMREYHSWNHYENGRDYYKWDSITTQPQGYSWPDHNRFVNAASDLGVQFLLDALGHPSWITGPVPNDQGDGSLSVDYREKIEFISQAVARYGSKTISSELLETEDGRTGLNLIKYYEDSNEQDYWWVSPQWPPEHYAAYLNAVHDGAGLNRDLEYPLLGIKSVDPDAVHVLGGLAKPDTVYLQKVLDALPQGRVPFDVLNFHMYASDHTNAYSPENEEYGFEPAFSRLMSWRDRNLPGYPVWITEFGWDTYLGPGNQHSYTYAPEAVQANYLVRSMFLFMHLGLEKAFMFMATDSDSEGLIQYASSGFLTDKESGYQKKASWYFLATMQKLIGDYQYDTTLSWREGNPELFHIRMRNFDHPSQQVHIFWCRTPESANDDGAEFSYSFQLRDEEQAHEMIRLKDGLVGGDTLSYAGASTGGRVTLEVSETPFLLFTELPANSVSTLSEEAVKYYPGAQGGLLFNSQGQLIRKNQDLPAGVYWQKDPLEKNWSVYAIQ